MGAKLYQRFEEECEVHIFAALQSLVGQNTDLVVFLSLVGRCWQDFCDQMSVICDLWFRQFYGSIICQVNTQCEAIMGHGLTSFPQTSFTGSWCTTQNCFWSSTNDWKRKTRLQGEHERCLIYLDASTRKPLIATAEKVSLCLWMEIVWKTFKECSHSFQGSMPSSH